MKNKVFKVAFWFVLSLSICFNGSVITASAIQITNSGKSKAIILVDPSANRDDRWIANQLKEYLKKISKADIKIVEDTNLPDHKKIETIIIIGMHPQLELIGIDIGSNLDDAYIIKTIDEHEAQNGIEVNIVALAGNGLRGTIYSVYAFLEEIGCRWFMPGDFGEVIPEKRTIQIDDMDILEIPDFELRHYAGDGARPKLSKKDRTTFKHWMLKNRYNRGFEKGYTHLDAFKGRGGHDYKAIIPHKMFSKNPEYFPLIGNKRINKGQRCTGNEDVLEETKKYVDRYFARHKNSEMLSLSPNDNNLWCKCEKCLALDGDDKFIQGSTKMIPTFSGRVFRFANSVSKYMSENHPDKYANIYAYAYYSAPPKDFVPNDNLIIKLCHNLNACDNHPVSSDCKYSTWFRENLIKKWKNLTPNLWYHHYTYRWKAYEIIWPMWNVVAEDIKYLHANDIWGFYAMGGSMNWGSNGLYYYIISRLLWDANADVNLIIDDYCKTFYEKSGPSMKNYFNYMANIFNDPNVHIRNRSGGNTYIKQFVDVYTPEVLNEAQKHLDLARKKAKKRPVIQKRIKITQFTHDYTKLLMAFVKSNMKSQETGSKADIKKTKHLGNQILKYLKNDYVPWSVTLKTGGFGARTYVHRVLKQYK